MAIIHPEGWQALKPTGAAQREIETLELLSKSLPDSYSVYHGVHWTKIDKGSSFFGEIDFAVVSPGGRLLLIEQKSGFLAEEPDGLMKHYGVTKKSVPFQMARTVAAVQERLRKYAPQSKFDVDSLLYCPDYTVKSIGSAGIPPERIVDAGKREHLPNIILSILRGEEEGDAKQAAMLHRFLADELELVPEIGAMVGQNHALFTRLSSGLAYWARQIELNPHRLRIIGTAGSGKTQLALAILRDAAKAGHRALYVCYNRPLADHLIQIAPPDSVIATYHQLADRIALDYGQAPDFTKPGAFERLESFMETLAPKEEWTFDELIVDEGQDFQESWFKSLMNLLREDGRAWWLEDPMQNLYGRPAVSLPGWAVMHADTNYRSPQDVVGAINQLLRFPKSVQPGSPVAGSNMEILTYTDARDLFDKTKTAITRAMGAGFTRSTIALVTFRGREKSRFTPLDQLGTIPLRSFTGEYDLFGNPVYNPGDLLIDSVYRFKGQSAPCVILTEIEFNDLDDPTLRKLFVGMTRASIKLILVIAEESAKKLLSRLES